MIMASTIHLSKCCPFIRYCIIYLCLSACSVNIFTRAGHNNIVLTKRAARVTMACIGHLCALFQLIVCRPSSNRNNLVHLEHALGKLVEVTTAYYIDSGIHQTNLYSLEIVRKISRSLHCHQLHWLGLGIVQVEFAGIFLHYIYIEVWIVDNLSYRYLSRDLNYFFHRLISYFFPITLCQMFKYFCVCSLDLEAFRAWEDKLLQHLLDHTVNIDDWF